MKICNMKNLLPQDGQLFFWDNFCPVNTNELYESHLFAEVPWQQKPIKIFGRQIMQPRMVAFMADPGVYYKYSGLSIDNCGWSKEVLQVKSLVESQTGLTFNSALLNFYRNGNDSMGWHSDNEKELGLNPAIASVSFGETRDFSFRHRHQQDLKLKLTLTSGSLMLMAGEIQHYWKHCLPKRPLLKQPRFNITFRKVLSVKDKYET